MLKYSCSRQGTVRKHSARPRFGLFFAGISNARKIGREVLGFFVLRSIILNKKLIIVASPPACGKTRLSKKIATEFYGCVYLDKDSLIPLSKRIFTVAKKPYNRSSEFFKREIRDYEYEAILNIATEALKYNDTVILNAPFSTELRDGEYMEKLKSRLSRVGARLIVVWINSDEKTCHANMKRRNSDRDKWKLEHWKEYIKNVDFTPPENVTGQLIVYDGRRDNFGNIDEVKRLTEALKTKERNFSD